MEVDGPADDGVVEEAHLQALQALLPAQPLVPRPPQAPSFPPFSMWVKGSAPVGVDGRLPDALHVDGAEDHLALARLVRLLLQDESSRDGEIQWQGEEGANTLQAVHVAALVHARLLSIGAM